MKVPYDADMESSIVNSNFAKWKQALLTREPRNVASLYADNATLLPTLAQKVMTDRESITSYFAFFDTFHPSVSKIVEEHVIKISDDSYVHCGIYRFHLTRDAQEHEVDARFSMVWKKVDGAWWILHHHSSQVPVI